VGARAIIFTTTTTSHKVSPKRTIIVPTTTNTIAAATTTTTTATAVLGAVRLESVKQNLELRVGSLLQKDEALVVQHHGSDGWQVHNRRTDACHDGWLNVVELRVEQTKVSRLQVPWALPRACVV